MAILLAGSSFGQGKGHGGGKGGGGEKHGGHPDRQERRGGDERRGDGNPWGGGGEKRESQQVERRQPQQWRQEQRQQMHVQRQQQADQWKVERQQQAEQWQIQRRQAEQAQRQQRDALRQQQRQWQDVQRQQQRVFVQPEQPRTNWGQIRRMEAFEAKRQRDALKYQERVNREDWKYERKQQRFADKALRKAGRHYQQTVPYVYEERDAWSNNDLYQPRYRDKQTYAPTYRDYRTYAPTYAPTYPRYNQPDRRIYDYSQGYYPYPGDIYADNGEHGYQRSSWVEPLIRSVIATFFSNGSGGGYYDDYSNDEPYYGNNYGYESEDAYYQPTHYTFGYAPSYTYYEPAAYYGYDQYADNGVPYDAVQDGLPYNDVLSIYSGGLAGEFIQRALGTGYYQGLLEGQLARQRGWGDRYYSDPYLYEQAIYDPYSSSLGDCRRYFSEGYEMGYEDALRGRDDFDLADGGDVDLVSLLLGNVLSLRG